PRLRTFPNNLVNRPGRLTPHPLSQPLSQEATSHPPQAGTSQPLSQPESQARLPENIFESNPPRLLPQGSQAESQLLTSQPHAGSQPRFRRPKPIFEPHDGASK